jgi:hypothetical protein
MLFLTAVTASTFVENVNARSNVAAQPAATPQSTHDVLAAEVSFKRLLDLQAKLKTVPIDKQHKQPYRGLLKANKSDIVYSEPAGEYYVRSDLFWDLRKKYRSLAIADRIAWSAAENPLPGECEGYVNCYLFKVRTTYGEYLRLYPEGKYTNKAVQKTAEFLKYIADDAASPKKNYDGPTENSERSEFARAIRELEKILSKVPHAKAAEAVKQLKQIEGAFK